MTTNSYLFPSQIKMTSFTINNKAYSHRELNCIQDFFTNEQWDIIDCALIEYNKLASDCDIDFKEVDAIKQIQDVIYELARTAY